jgi:hypothetical protein
MAVDTKQKRQSSFNFIRAFSLRLQFPDGTIDQGDRQTALISYSGILAGAITDAIRDLIGGFGIIPFRR